MAQLQNFLGVKSRGLFWCDLNWNNFSSTLCAIVLSWQLTTSKNFSSVSPGVWRWSKKKVRVKLLKHPPPATTHTTDIRLKQHRARSRQFGT